PGQVRGRGAGVRREDPRPEGVADRRGQGEEGVVRVRGGAVLSPGPRAVARGRPGRRGEDVGGGSEGVRVDGRRGEVGRAGEGGGGRSREAIAAGGPGPTGGHHRRDRVRQVPP